MYTGAYLDRTIDNAMDYTNYARSQGGFYYTCVGGGAPIGKGVGPLTCYSPVSSWNDHVETTHQSHELRLSTPDDWRLRGLVGAFWEDFDIKDDMNFLYKSIPSCTPANLLLYQAGTQVCVGNVIPPAGYAAIDPTVRNDNVAFGEDLERGYKQTALFTSIDYDLIPKVLTLTGGTRYYHYTETFRGSQYSTSTGCAGIPNGTVRGLRAHRGDARRGLQRLPQPRQSDLARHAGRDGLLHLLAGLSPGRRQPQEQRRDQDRRRRRRPPASTCRPSAPTRTRRSSSSSTSPIRIRPTR